LPITAAVSGAIDGSCATEDSACAFANMAFRALDAYTTNSFNNAIFHGSFGSGLTPCVH
jgi:hypothetical protein